MAPRRKSKPAPPLPAKQAAAAPEAASGLRDGVAALVASGQHAAALKQLALLRLRAPGEAFGYVEAARLLLDAGRGHDAEALLASGLKRTGAAAAIAVPYAMAAMQRQAWAEAATRWARARALHPRDPDCQAGELAALRLAGRATQAEALAAGLRHGEDWATVERRVDDLLAANAPAAPAVPAATAPETAQAVDVSALVHAGHAAAGAGQWVEADRAWSTLRAVATERADGWSHGAKALRGLGRPAEAQALLMQGLQALPDHPSLLMALGYHAAEDGAWEDARAHWTQLRTVAPTSPEGWVQGATTLLRLGEPDAAEDLLADAFARMPDNVSVLVRRAFLAGERGEWAEALPRWRLLAARVPDHPLAQPNIAKAEALLAGG